MSITDPRQLLEIVLRHRLAFAVTLLATVLAVAAVLFTRTSKYEASATLLVQLGREYRSQPGVGDRPTVLNRDPEAALNTELYILTSSDLIQAVVARLGPESLYPALADSALTESEKQLEAAEAFAAAFTARIQPTSSVIRVTFVHPDPEMAGQALSTAVDVFQEKHLQTFGNPRVPPFLEEKVADFRDRLERSEGELEVFVLADETLYLEEHGRLLLERRAGLESEFNQSSNRIAGLKQQIAFLGEQQRLAAYDGLAAAKARESRIIQNARLNLLDLQVEEKRLLGSFSENSRRVTAVREQIKTIESFLAEQEELIGRGGAADQLAEQMTALEAELSFEMAKAEGLAEQMAWLERRLATLPTRSKRYRELVRERDMNEKSYRTYAAQLEEARLLDQLDREKISNISLIQEVRVGSDPLTLNKKLRLLVGALLGLVLGTLVAFLAEMKDRQAAGVPAVGIGTL